MVWNDQKDDSLCKEILLFEPYRYKIRTKEKENAWTAIADSLNEVKSQNFQVDQRAVCDRFNTLKSRYTSKMNYEETAGGIFVKERTAVEQVLEDILAEEKEWSKQHDMESEEKAEKAEGDRLTAEDMRLKSLETFAETKKEKKQQGIEDEESLDKKS